MTQYTWLFALQALVFIAEIIFHVIPFLIKSSGTKISEWIFLGLMLGGLAMCCVLIGGTYKL
jgi:hypothetical protein